MALPLDPQWLLGQREWLHALARSLVGDASLADDVVQDTWLAALSRPPAARSGGQVRAFLATVLRRAARRAWGIPDAGDLERASTDP